jgi:hypothetical protein
MRASMIVLWGLSLTLASEVIGTGWEILGSYSAPAPNARSIARDAPYPISVLCDGNPPRVYNLYQPGQYITLGVPQGAWGLTTWYQWPNNLVVSNHNNGFIYRLTKSGSVISSFRCPKPHPADLGGGLYSKSWVAIPDENLAIEVTTTGSVLNSFSGLGTRLTAIDVGLSFRTDAIMGDPATHRVYFLGHGALNMATPAGLWASRRTGEPPYANIWVVNAADNRIYWIDSSGGETVGPASFGRVKGLFN